MNLGTLIATLTVETAGLKRGVIDFGMLEKKILAGSNKMVRQLGTLSAAVKRVDKNITAMAVSPTMSVWEKKMLAATNKMVRQLGRVTNQTRMLKKELLLLQSVGGMMGGGIMGGGKGKTKGTGIFPVMTPGFAAGAEVPLGITKGLPDPKQLARTWGATLSSMSMRLRSFGWLATTVFTAPLIMGASAVSKLGREYEMAMAKIQGLVGINKRMVDEWNKSLLNMSKAVAIGPMELADTLYYVASSGFKTKEALNITEMSAKGAATGLGETKDIANFLTSAMNAYRASGLSAARAMDILTAAVREGKGEPAEMARALGTILPIASELGVSLDQVGGALASMTLITSQTSNAATYLRNVLMKLIHPSAGTEKALARMGTSIEELQNILRTQGLMPALLKIRELTDKYGESVADIFPNIRGLLGMLNLTGQNMKYNEKVMKEVTASMGDFERAFFIASGTVAFKWNAAVAGMKASFIKLGTVVAQLILPIMEKWIGRIDSIVKWFNNLSRGSQRLLVHFAEILAIMGPLSLLFSAFGIIIGGVKEALTALGIRVGVFSALLKSIPWVLAIVAALKLVSVIARLIKKKNELNRITKEVTAATETEVNKMRYLYEVATSLTAGYERNVAARRELNDIYGIYLNNLVDEEGFISDIADAYKGAEEKLRAFIDTKERERIIEEKRAEESAQFAKHLGEYDTAAKKYFSAQQYLDFSEALRTMLKQMNDLKTSEDDAMSVWVKGQGYVDDFMSQWGEMLQFAAKTAGDNKIAKAMESMWAGQDSRFEASLYLLERQKFAIDSVVNEQLRMIGINDEIVKKIEELADKSNSAYNSIKNEGIRGLMQSMEELEKAIVREDELMVGTGQESEAAAKKMDLYAGVLRKLAIWTTPEAKLLDVEAATEAQEMIEGIQQKMKSLRLEIDDLKKDIETLTDVVDDFNKELAFLDLIQMHKDTLGELGQQFDYVGEKTKLYESTLKKLVEKGWIEEQQAKDMIVALQNMEANIFPVTTALNELVNTLELVQLRAKFEGPKFDVVAAGISAYEAAYNKVIEGVTKMDNLETTVINIQVDATGATQTIKLVDYLNWLITKLYNNIEALKDVQQAMIDQETINLLQAEADAFGGVVGKIDVLNYALEAAERNLRALFRKQKMGIVPEEDIIRAVENINILKNSIASLNEALDLKYLQDMYAALNNVATGADLLDGYINSLEEELRRLSADAKGNTEAFKELAKQYQMYKNIGIMMEKVNEVMEGFIRTLIEGGDETESLGEKINKYLIATLKDLVADLLTAIAKFILLKVVVESLQKSFAKSDFGKGLLESITKGLTGLTGLGVFTNIFKTDKITEFITVLDALKVDMGEYNGIIKNLLTSQNQVTDVVAKSTTSFFAAAEATGALTEMQKVEGITLDSLVAADKARAASQGLVKAATAATTATDAASIPIKAGASAASFQSAGASAVEGAAKTPFPFSLIAMALAGALVIGIIASIIASSRKARKMAGGGIVPPGYPGDTFPALLTSGEKVIPLDRMEKQTLNLEGAEVRFEIEGDRLVGILKKQLKKSSIY
jgi:TP901 family phage tail tape measure protein